MIIFGYIGLSKMFLKLFSPAYFYFWNRAVENYKLYVQFIFVAHIIFPLDGAALSFSVEGGKLKLLSVSRFY